MKSSEKPKDGAVAVSQAVSPAVPGAPPAPAQHGGIRPDGKLDTVGFFCPIPIIKTGARIRGMEEGETLEVISDDRVILVDLPNWCRGAGHEYLGHFETEREIHLFVKKRARPASPNRGHARVEK
jgi:tRNA 2-thiouridine synthesizing protein A